MRRSKFNRPETIEQLEAILGKNITYGGPCWTVPGLLFEKKGLIPRLQELITPHVSN